MIERKPLRELTYTEVDQVAGGYDEGNWCGTPVPHQPLPGLHSSLVQQVVAPVAAVTLTRPA